MFGLLLSDGICQQILLLIIVSWPFKDDIVNCVSTKLNLYTSLLLSPLALPQHIVIQSLAAQCFKLSIVLNERPMMRELSWGGTDIQIMCRDPGTCSTQYQ